MTCAWDASGGVRPDVTAAGRLRQEPSDEDAERLADQGRDVLAQDDLPWDEAVHPLEAQSALAELAPDKQDAGRSEVRSCAAAEAEPRSVVPDEALLAFAQQEERLPQAQTESEPQAA